MRNSGIIVGKIILVLLCAASCWIAFGMTFLDPGPDDPRLFYGEAALFWAVFALLTSVTVRIFRKTRLKPALPQS